MLNFLWHDKEINAIIDLAEHIMSSTIMAKYKLIQLEDHSYIIFFGRKQNYFKDW